MTVPEDRLMAGEKRALKVANEVLQDLNAPQLDAITDLFNVAEHFLCTFPELDFFRKERTEVHYWGPVTVAEWGARPQWPEDGGKKIFAYLKTRHRGFEEIIRTLSDLPCSTLVFAPGISESVVDQYTSSRLHFSQEPIDMDYGRESCDLAICHAGHGTTTRMLLAGRPLLLLPLNLEQLLRAMSVEKEGAGLVVHPEAKNPDYKQLLTRLTEEETFTGKARAIAERYGDLDSEAQVDEMVKRCEEIINS
jgi:UDP:flavonoid glycosyltransferase YjiC (YdhE family)